MLSERFNLLLCVLACLALVLMGAHADLTGRITDIVAPGGSVLSYQYDPSGDLITSVDRVGEPTQYTYVYGRPHLLEDIADPRGIRVSRNEYDDGSHRRSARRR